MEKNCEYCGKPFPARGRVRRFCSTVCRDANLRVVVAVACEVCGKELTRRPWQLKRGEHVFCGQACYAKSRTGVPHPAADRFQPSQQTCEVCGAFFFVGGRGNPAWGTRFCSRECRWAGRYRQGKNANPLTDTQAAYIAGIIDGEGSVMIVAHHAAFAIKVSVSNGDRPLLEWLETTTGIGGIVATRAATERTRATWIWHVNGEGAESLLKQIAPYMLVKAKQAAIAIEFHGRLRQPALKADRTWQAEWRLKMQALNKRGPRAASDD